MEYPELLNSFSNCKQVVNTKDKYANAVLSVHPIQVKTIIGNGSLPCGMRNLGKRTDTSRSSENLLGVDTLSDVKSPTTLLALSSRANFTAEYYREYSQTRLNGPY